MNINIYKITFSISSSRLDELYNYLPISDRDQISDLYVISSFSYDLLENHIVYMLIDQKEIKLYRSLLDTNLIPYICNNISQNVIDNKIELEYSLQNFIDKSNYSDYDNFIIELNLWILDNLTIDNILDRISVDGLESLRFIDKEFLKRF